MTGPETVRRRLPVEGSDGGFTMIESIIGIALMGIDSAERGGGRDERAGRRAEPAQERPYRPLIEGGIIDHPLRDLLEGDLPSSGRRSPGGH